MYFVRAQNLYCRSSFLILVWLFNCDLVACASGRTNTLANHMSWQVDLSCEDDLRLLYLRILQIFGIQMYAKIFTSTILVLLPGSVMAIGGFLHVWHTFELPGLPPHRHSALPLRHASTDIHAVQMATKSRFTLLTGSDTRRTVWQ